MKGEHEGVIMTAGDQLTREIKVVNPSHRAPVEHSTKSMNPPPASLDQHKTHGFLSFTFTMAQCKNILNKWNQMVRKHLREDRLDKPFFLSRD